MPPSAFPSRKIRARLERRRGKIVTIVEGLLESDDTLKILLKNLQKQFGTGGTVKAHHLELQGDWLEKIKVWLAQQTQKQP